MVLKTVAKISLIAVLTLVALEGILRLSGAILEHFNKKGQVQATFAPNEIRILILGESTTAPLMNGGADQAWSGKVRDLLAARLKNKQITVLNLALPGTTSTFLLRSARLAIRDFRPHVIVSMMGVNDSGRVEEQNAFISNLKIRKLLWEVKRQIHWREAARFYSCTIEPDTNLTAEEVRTIVQLAKDAKNPVDALVKAFPNRDAEGLFRTAGHLLWAGSPKHAIPEGFELNVANDFFQRVYSARPDCFSSVNMAVFGWQAIKRFELCQEILVGVHDRGIALNEPLLRSLGECTSKMSTPSGRRVLAEYELRIDNMRPVDRTFANYRQLAELAAKEKIQYVAMMYPTRAIALLRAVFTDRTPPRDKTFWDYIQFDPPPVMDEEILPAFRDVIFVENRSRFEEALRTQGIPAVFNDLFAQSFGHTTDLGHQLIAESLTDVLTKKIEEM